MKGLLAHASNLFLIPELKEPPKVRAQIELILICSEASYSYGLEGLARGRDVSDLRVMCGHKELREMATQLLSLAAEAESLEKVMNGLQEERGHE